MADLKTKVNKNSVEKFLNQVGNARRREDALAVLKLMKSVTGKAPRMWGSSIVGFDQYHYKYESGREGDICMIGFSPRSQALTLYLMPPLTRYDSLMKKLGKFKTGQGCLYIKKLEDVDLRVLKETVAEAYFLARDQSS